MVDRSGGTCIMNDGSGTSAVDISFSILFSPLFIDSAEPWPNERQTSTATSVHHQSLCTAPEESAAMVKLWQ